MRAIILFALLVSASTIQAQTFIPTRLYDNSCSGATPGQVHLSDSISGKKWSLSKYSGISTSVAFFQRGNATIVSAPIGLQLNRRLNNNLYAFAGVSAAPAYLNFSRTFMYDDFKTNQQTSLFRSGSLGLYSRAELGLQYTNDEKTFSISGSIGIGRSSYPLLQYGQINNPIVTPVFSSSR
jgi:hypothetical protein